MADRFDQGDLVHVTGTWTDPLNSNAPIDPTVVMLSVKDPSGTVTTYTYGSTAITVKDSAGTETTSPTGGAGMIVQDDVGIYSADIDVTSEGGRWYYRWFSTGTGQAAEEELICIDVANAI